MKCLVIGASGFIGRNLCKLLVDAGHWVVGVGRRNRKKSGLPMEVDYRHDDCLGQHNDFGAGWCARTYDVLYWLVGETNFQNIKDNKKALFDLHTTAIMNMLWTCKANRIVYASSGKVYSPGHIGQYETSSTVPNTPLGKAKLIGEQLVRECADCPVALARIFNVYGPEQPQHMLVPTILNQLKDGNEISLGSTHHVRDYTHVLDVAKALMVLGESKEVERTVIANVASGRGTTAQQIVDLIGVISGRKIKVNVDQAKTRPTEAMNTEVGNAGWLNREGWHPQITLEDGLTELVERELKQAA